MSETRQLLALWDAAEAAGDDWALATVVRVSGSTYRKPGARMMITKSGQRSGMVSGGCLEAEISKKIWWLTENGPTIQCYSTFFDDDGNPSFGLGCGGTVDVLLERSTTAGTGLRLVRESVEQRTSAVLLTVVESSHIQFPAATQLAYLGEDSLSVIIPALDHESTNGASLALALQKIAAGAWEDRLSSSHTLTLEDKTIELFAESIHPPFHLFLFGAGDDAQPLATLAHTLGWRTTIADSRANLLHPGRFPTAETLARISIEAPIQCLGLTQNDSAVLMTHSYAQDRALLQALLPRGLAYLGVLGPRRRTLQLIEEVAPDLGLTTEEAMSRLRAPVGLDLGADSPTTIALSIIAEIQSTLHARAAVPSTVSR